MKLEDLARAGIIITGNQAYGPNDVRRASAKVSRQTHILPNHPGADSQLERTVGDGTLAAVQAKKGLGRQFLIRIISVRKHLLDYDNLAEKYHVDLCRYAGIVPGDSPATTRIEVCQQKVEPGAREEVRIEVFEL